MPKVTHYRHPKLGYHACGMGDRHKVTMSDDISQVTCKRCQTTITGQSAGGRPPKNGKPKERLNLRIDSDLKTAAVELGINLSELLEEAIKLKIEAKL